ncbi:hypothetical protein [Mycobacterium shigaense]|uniref:Putative membrane protein n=1 Tax=Mycobacterium shigaense TaxID=722731 RepID=A0A1Z4EJ89_9MYCO|nr:hypothetical protein [Mycobacterium shigaense]MEA1123986.1 hypothetical protein [Mycobacterium shigaense]BAX93002.1 putative membrane protein [Mycobacterium shigaense]
MDTFTLDPHSWRIGILFDRNPLIRRTDRIEAMVLILAVVASLIGVPIVAVVGAMTYGSRAHLYAHPATPSTPCWPALGDALAIGGAAFLFLAVTVTSLVVGVRSWLDRSRDAQWEHALNCMQGDGGRRNQR